MINLCDAITVQTFMIMLRIDLHFEVRKESLKFTNLFLVNKGNSSWFCQQSQFTLSLPIKSKHSKEYRLDLGFKKKTPILHIGISWLHMLKGQYATSSTSFVSYYQMAWCLEVKAAFIINIVIPSYNLNQSLILLSIYAYFQPKFPTSY